MEFKTLKDFEQYEISDTGVIRNKKTGRVLNQRIGLGGYYNVVIYSKKLKKSICRRVHRLVAMTYIDNPDNLPEVDHKDHNKLNNEVSNLRWVTKQENLLNREWCKPIDMCDKKTNKRIMRFNTITEAAKWLKTNKVNFTAARVAICQACQGNRPSAYGYNWKYSYNDYSDEAKADFKKECKTVRAFAAKHPDIMWLASEIKD